MGYRLLEHATDAIVQVDAASMDEAFSDAGQAVADITLDSRSVKEAQSRRISAAGEDARHLLYSWLEEVVYLMITDGFAVSRVEARAVGDPPRRVEGTALGEPIDLGRHGFKVEIKAPTFHGMEIARGAENVKMKFLLDL